MDRLFFFQAEDGIRDSSVTGVQTCALPISSRNLSLCTKPSRLVTGRLYPNYLSSMSISLDGSENSGSKATGPSRWDIGGGSSAAACALSRHSGGAEGRGAHAFRSTPALPQNGWATFYWTLNSK